LDSDASVRERIASDAIVVARERRVGLDEVVAVQPALRRARGVVRRREPGRVRADGHLARVDVATERDTQSREDEREVIVELQAMLSDRRAIQALPALTFHKFC
jgi:hypothetical protein